MLPSISRNQPLTFRGAPSFAILSLKGCASMSIITLEAVGFQPYGTPILQEISFTVPKGAYLAISGPSGGGKSTLLKLIATLLTPTTGEIDFQGKPQSAYPVTEYRRQVSYCFQQPQLFGETVEDNLRFPFEIRQEEFKLEKVRELLRQVDLPERFLDKSILELSGGERQRVALIRNLVFLPQVLLLDEVTVGLDEESKQIVQALIRQVHSQGVTILQVSHDEEDLRQAKGEIKIEGGRLVHESISGQ